MTVDPSPHPQGAGGQTPGQLPAGRVAARRVTGPAPVPHAAPVAPVASPSGGSPGLGVPTLPEPTDTAVTEQISLRRSAQRGRPARRPPPLLLGAGGAAIAALLAGASLVNQPTLALVVFLVQVVLSLGWLALIDAPASGGSFLVAAGAAIATDILVLVDDSNDLAPLAGVLGLAMLAALAHQIARSQRVHVTESLASTLAIVVLVVSAAQLIALRGVEDGRDAVTTTLAAAAAAMVVGRVVDTVLPRPTLADAAHRGWIGLGCALAAGAAAGAAVGNALDLPSTNAGALLGIAAAALASAADLAIDLGASELRAGRRDRRRVEALAPVGILLPVAAVAPVAFLAGRSLLG